MFKTSRLCTEEEKRCQRGDEEGKTTRGVVQIVREEKADVKQRRRRWRRQIRDKRDDSRRGKTERGVFSEKTYRGWGGEEESEPERDHSFMAPVV